MPEPTVKGRVVTHADGHTSTLAYTPSAGSIVQVDGKAVVVQPAEPAALRTIKCPHCNRVTVEGSNVCCQALATELNKLASSCDDDLDKLTRAFEAWFKQHRVETGAHGQA